MTTRAGLAIALSILPVLLALGACADDPCPLQPLDGAGDGENGPGSAAACPELMEVGGRTYVAESEYPLTDAGVDSLVPYGTVQRATVAAAVNMESPADRTVWSFSGGDPEWVLWGTYSTLRGTRWYVLWIAKDYPGHPYLCDVVDTVELAKQLAESPDNLEVPPIVRNCA